MIKMIFDVFESLRFDSVKALSICSALLSVPRLTFALDVIQIGKLCGSPISCTVTGQRELELDDR